MTNTSRISFFQTSAFIDETLAAAKVKFETTVVSAGCAAFPIPLAALLGFALRPRVAFALCVC